MDDRGAKHRWTRWIPAGYSALLALFVTAPLLGPGHLLLRDAVSTPRSYLTDSALGLGDAAPRAVPQDALLAALSSFVDGALVVKAILVVALWAAGFGAAVLSRQLIDAPVATQLVASTLTIWNPYIAERLLQGHWSLLTGYAALPWTAAAVVRLRNGRPGSWAAVTGCLAAAGLTPTGGLLAGVLAVSLVGRRRILPMTSVVAAVCLPWLVAAAVSGVAAEPSDPAGVSAFAARAEPGLGTLGSLAGLAGIWNAEAVPNSRTTPLAAVGTALLLLVVALGVRAVAADDDDRVRTRARRTLLLLAAAAIILPALAATPPGISALEWLVGQVPGAGLLRDTQKYVALAVPAYALCAAATCRVPLARLFRGDSAPAVVRGTAMVFIALLILPLADLGWGVAGQVRAIRYPNAWREVAQRLDGPGDVAVLPAGMFRRFPYSGSAPVLDPAPRMLPRDVLQTGELPVHGRTVAGEGARARMVEDLLLRGGPPEELARLGVGWVLVENTSPGPLGDSRATLAALEPVHTTADLDLYRVPGVRAEPGATHRGLVVAAHIGWAVLLFAPLLALRPRVRIRVRKR
ncbi:hypothetical protein [Nocardia paucivorans]|uniref:hypothetical protein n=1 Tax=Nocardia paucivorans TaxID=114259 RepID=UPI0002E37E06|nr:hypothetical protein [Nocardia paucivorans]